MSDRRHWFSATESAALCGVTTRGFAALRALIEPQYVKAGGRGRKTMIDVRGLILAVVAREQARRRAATDPLRRRRERARAKRDELDCEARELDLAERAGKVIRREDVRQTYQVWAGALRNLAAKWNRIDGSFSADLDRVLNVAAQGVVCVDGRVGLQGSNAAG